MDKDKEHNIDRLFDRAKLNLAGGLDNKLYIPMKIELKGISHSLGFKKEIFKEFMEAELDKLKIEIKANC